MTSVTQSFSKMQASRKLMAPGSNPLADEDVAKEYIIILLAGFATEKLLQMKGDNVVPNRECAEPDYNQARTVLSRMNQGEPQLDAYETVALEKVKECWSEIELVACLIFDHGNNIDATIVLDALRVPIP